MSRLIVTDSVSTERIIKRLFATDTGGIERNIQRLFVIDSAGIARLVFAPGVVQLDAASTTDVDPGVFVRAGFTFNDDGTISASGNGAPVGLKWFSTAPVSGIGANHQIRRTDAGSYDVNAANQNIWTTFPAEWELFIAGAASPSSKGENLVIEIREGTSGLAEDSATFSINVSN